MDVWTGLSRDDTNALMEYLQSPGFRRLWPAVKDKLQRLGRVGGRVTMTSLDADEQLSLEGLLGVNLYGKRDCAVDLRRLDEALQRTRFEVSLESCMNLLYPGYISHREARAADAAAWDAFVTWSQSMVDQPSLVDWVRSLARGTGAGAGAGYRTFRECFEEFGDAGESLSWLVAAHALEALLQLEPSSSTPGKRNRLPVFAAKTTGDAHGLDRNTRAGRMFFWGLVAVQEHTRGDAADFDEGDLLLMDSESIRGLYLRFGLVLDDISSIVWVAGLPGVAVEPMAVTLWTVDRLHQWKNQAEISDVYIVENPSIFGALIDAASADGRRLPHPLICPSGQPSLAALRLLDELAGAGAILHYSGDFDVAGVQIAVSLATRYGDAFLPWRMSARDYNEAFSRAIRGMDGRRVQGVHGVRLVTGQGAGNGRRPLPELPKLTAEDKARLSRIQLPWESGANGSSLTDAMVRTGAKVFQEHLVDELCRDYWG